MLEYFMRHTGQLLTQQIHQHLWKMAINPVATYRSSDSSAAPQD